MRTYKHYGNKYAYTSGLGKATILSKLLCPSRYFKTTVKCSIRAISNYMYIHTPNAHAHAHMHSTRRQTHTCTNTETHTQIQMHSDTDKHRHTCTVHITHLIF